MSERDAIVAWLRKNAEELRKQEAAHHKFHRHLAAYQADIAATQDSSLANAIERGEHLDPAEE